MAIVDDAVALLKQWQSQKKTVMFSSNGSVSVAAEGEGNISFHSGELVIGPLAARTTVDASSVQSVQDGRIAVTFGGTVVTLSIEP
jgi:hypothetical protein